VTILLVMKDDENRPYVVVVLEVKLQFTSYT
jgi:hypothetical protein